MISAKTFTIYILLLLLSGILMGAFILGIILSVDRIVFIGVASSFILVITRWTVGKEVMKHVEVLRKSN